MWNGCGSRRRRSTGWRELEAESGEELLLLNGMLELFREGVISSEEALRRRDADVRAL